MKLEIAVLTLAFLCATAHGQNTGPSGSYGFLVNDAFLDAGDGNGGSVLGVLTFDGSGGITGTYTLRGRGGPDDQASGAVTGSYSINPGGTGTATLTFDAGFTGTLAMVLVDGARGIQFLQADSLGGGDVPLRGTAQSVTGSLPFSVFAGSPGQGASGSIPLTLTGTSNQQAGITIYSATPATGTGTLPCSPDGSSGSWSAAVASLTVATFPDVTSLGSGASIGAGSFHLAISSTACDHQDFQFLSGTAQGNVAAGGAVNLTLHFFPEVFSGTARSGQTGSVNGSYGVQLNYSPFPAGTVAVWTFDGAGKLSVSSTTTAGVNAGQKPVSSNSTGTYTVNPDGTGTAQLLTPNGQPGPTYAFVTTDNGSGILLLQTNLAARGTVGYGTGRLQ